MRYLRALLCRLGLHPWQAFEVSFPMMERRVCLHCHRKERLAISSTYYDQYERWEVA